MSKELTEQWKNGTLEAGYYYFKTSTGLVVGFQLKGFKYPYTWCGTTIDDVSKVLAPVSDYNQFVELTEKVERFEKLLKECKGVIDECVRSDYIEELKERIDEVLK